MEQIASQTVGAVVNILTGIFIKHLRYLTSSNKYVTYMTNKLNVLVCKSDDVKRHLDKNNEDRKEIPTRVPFWLEDVENIKKDVESISSNVFGCLHMKKRYRAGRKAFEAIEKIERLIDEEKEIKWSDAIIPLGKVYSKVASTSGPSPSVQITHNGFTSRDKAFNDALKFLQQEGEGSQVIALCGMGGVGKTTMMEQLKEVVEDGKMFHWIVKVAIGQNPNMISIQNDVAEYLRDQDLPPGASKILRADHLCKKIKNLSQDGKKILVILDDVWDNIELKDIGLTSPLPKGVKLLLTSRISNICTQIAACLHSNLQEVRVDVLEEREAQFFFAQIAGISEEHNLDLYHIGRDIVKKCGYLPLAIKLIASTLKSKNYYVWEDTHSCLMNNHFDDVVQEIIRISYKYIKKDERLILLHCGLFPEDFNISIQDLMRHAWGLKLFKDVYTLKKVRNRTNTCVHNLIDANLLMNGDHLGYVKMHDLVLAFVLGEVSEGNYDWIINHGDVSKWEKDERGDSCKSISLTCKGLSEFPLNLKYPNLSLLQLIHGDMMLRFSDDFYENVKNLKVIAYYEIQYPVFPRSLTNLTTLCLHECDLMFDCSFIGDLVNLEVLSFAHSGIRKLPSTIGNLRNLKVLDLTGCNKLRIDDGVFKNLFHLEELYMRVQRFSNPIRFTQANIEELKMLLSKLCVLEVEFVERNTWPENFSFMKLDEFKISIGCSFKIHHNDELSFRKMLNLVTDATYVRDCKVNELIKKTENLHLEVKDMIRLEDIVSTGPSNQRSFCNLRDLEVSKCAELKYLLPIYVASGLRKLERLKISKCSVLEALVHVDRREINSVDEIINFEELKFLSLEDLPNLVTLFAIENVVKLPQLVELKVDKLPNFTNIYPYKNNNSTLEQPLFNSKVRISQLKKLTIISMVKLKHIWPCEIDNEDLDNISLLREINVVNCDSLLNIFPTNPMPLFNNLEKLCVHSCGSIKEIFNIDLESKSKDEQISSTNSLLRSIEVRSSQNLREVWRIKGGENNSSLLISGFEDVKSVKIINCERYKNLFTPTNIKLDLGALTEIYIDWDQFHIHEKSKLSPREERDDNISTVAFPSNVMHSFSNLHELKLSNLNDVEVVFETKRRNNSTDLVTTTNNQQPLLPNLQHLCVFGMERMSHVWKCNSWDNFLILRNQSSFHDLTTIEIWKCNRIKYLFSPLMAKLLSNLKEINISECDGMEEVVSNRDDEDEDEEMTASSIVHDESKVFETQGTNKDNGGGITSTSIQKRNDGGTDSPRLEKWNAPQMFNLKKLVIRSCNLLKHVFMFSTLESLIQLEELRIKDCEAMEVVVKKENEEPRTLVEFPHLKSLELVNLPKLKGFFLGINEFHWPQLENVTISNCQQIIVFTCGASITSKLKYIHTSLGKHSLECGLNFRVTTPHQLPSSESTSMCSATLESLPWSFHNLIEIDVAYNRSAKNIIPSNGLLQLQKLERIRAGFCETVEEVFEVEAMEGTTSESQTLLVPIPNLTQVWLHDMRNLKYILWKSNHHVLKFPNLTKLDVFNCFELEHVFTTSMVGSLLQLQELGVDWCNNIEVIVKEEESEFECDAKEKEIVTLPCLKSLKLFNLKSLKGFCLGKDDFSFPSLHTLEIIECPEITIFTKGDVATPALHVIVTNIGGFYGKEDLNSCIKAIRHQLSSSSYQEEHYSVLGDWIRKNIDCNYASIHRYAHLLKKPSPPVPVFLVPTVVLVKQEYYHGALLAGSFQVPTILGMTASPIKAKGSSSSDEYWRQISELENLLRAKVYTCASESVLAESIPFSTAKFKFYKDVKAPF